MAFFSRLLAAEPSSMMRNSSHKPPKRLKLTP